MPEIIDSATVTWAESGGDLSATVPHVAATDNPHSVTAAQVSALSTSGGTVSGDVVIDGSLIAKEIVTNVEAGTTYTLALSDAGKVVALTSSSAVTITVPANASVAFPVGSVIEFEQRGAGTVTFAAAGGVTVSSLNGSLSISGQYGTAAVRKTATDNWILLGALA